VLRGLYSAAAGMYTASQLEDVVSANLANVDTPGYKEIMTQQGPLARQQLTLGGVTQLGSVYQGDRLDVTLTDWSAGTPHAVANPLAAALVGPGFFAVQTPGGVRYTRDGDFRLAAGGQLVTAAGAAVLGRNGPVRVPANASVSIGDGGVVNVNGKPADQLRVVNAANPQLLVRDGSGLYRDGGGAGLTPVAAPAVRGGMLESSNVDPVQQMVALMELERAYEGSQRLVQSMDSTLGVAVDTVGKVS